MIQRVTGIRPDSATRRETSDFVQTIEPTKLIKKTHELLKQIYKVTIFMFILLLFKKFGYETYTTASPWLYKNGLNLVIYRDV